MTADHGNPDGSDSVAKTPVEARQAETSGRARWMLRISLALGVLVLGGVFIGYTATQHKLSPATASAPQTSTQTAGAG